MNKRQASLEDAITVRSTMPLSESKAVSLAQSIHQTILASMRNPEQGQTAEEVLDGEAFVKVVRTVFEKFYSYSPSGIYTQAVRWAAAAQHYAIYPEVFKIWVATNGVVDAAEAG